MTELPSGQVTVLGAVDPAARRLTRLGIGLLLSLPVGWPAIAGALGGSATFEVAVLRFVLTVAATVGAVLTLGWLWDGFTMSNTRAQVLAERQAREAARPIGDDA